MAVGLIGTAIFWALICWSYCRNLSRYLVASWQAISTSNSTMASFPVPSASLLFSSVPAVNFALAMFCMIAMTISSARAQGATSFRAHHDSTSRDDPITTQQRIVTIRDRRRRTHERSVLVNLEPETPTSSKLALDTSMFIHMLTYATKLTGDGPSAVP